MTARGPARAPAARPVAGRAWSGYPGGASSGGGLYSSAGIYYNWNTNAQFTAVGPFVYPQIQGSSIIGQTVLGNDVWNPITGWQQQLYAANPGNWVVLSNIPAGNAAVVSYPSVGQYYSNPGDTSQPFLLSGCTSFYSSFNEIQPTTPGIISEAAYDTWWNDSDNEIMMQHDMVDPSGNRGVFQVIDIVSFGGTGGVPVQDWSLGIFGSEIIWQLTEGSGLYGGGIQSGTIDLRAMVNWLADRGYLVNPLATTTLVSIGYGWEICSTGGVTELYRCNGLSSSFTYSPMETSPGLELYGFTISGPTSGSTINSVTVNVTEYQSDLGAQPCTIQLWDYSGTPAQIGVTALGARSTSASNVSSASFYDVTYAQLATLRVRVYGNMASGYTESVGGVSLTVNYTGGSPPAPANSNAGYSLSMGSG